VISAERHAGIDALIGEIEFAQTPQYFLDIDRIGPAPNGQSSLIVVRHVVSLLMIRFERVISENARKSPRHLAISTTPPRKKAPPCMAEPDLRRSACADISGRRTATTE
jgi:hypothetical protein